MKQLTRFMIFALTLCLCFASHCQAAPSIPPDIVFAHQPISGSVAFSPDGRWLALSGDTTELPGTTFYNTSNWQEVKPAKLQSFESSCDVTVAEPAVWTADSRHLLISFNGGGGGQFAAVGVPGFNLERAWSFPPESEEQWLKQICSPGQNLFAGIDGGGENKVFVNNFLTGRAIYSIPCPGGAGICIAVSSDQKYMAIGQQNDVMLVDTKLRAVSHIERLPGEPQDMAFAPDNSCLDVVYINSDSKSLAMFINRLDVKGLQTIGNPLPVQDVYSFEQIAFSPDGKSLFLSFSTDIGSNPGAYITVCNPLTLACEARLKPVPGRLIDTAMSVSPDGKYLALSTDQQLSIWLLNKLKLSSSNDRVRHHV